MNVVGKYLAVGERGRGGAIDCNSSVNFNIQRASDSERKRIGGAILVGLRAPVSFLLPLTPSVTVFVRFAPVARPFSLVSPLQVAALATSTRAKWRDGFKDPRIPIHRSHPYSCFPGSLKSPHIFNILRFKKYHMYKCKIDRGNILLR